MNKRAAKITIALLIASLPLIAAQAAENSDTNWTWMKGANTTNQVAAAGVTNSPQTMVVTLTVLIRQS